MNTQLLYLAKLSGLGEHYLLFAYMLEHCSSITLYHMDIGNFFISCQNIVAYQPTLLLFEYVSVGRTDTRNRMKKGQTVQTPPTEIQSCFIHPASGVPSVVHFKTVPVLWFPYHLAPSILPTDLANFSRLWGLKTGTVSYYPKCLPASSLLTAVQMLSVIINDYLNEKTPKNS